MGRDTGGDVAAWRKAVDGLLPVPPPGTPPAGCGTAIAGGGAAGTCRHREADTGSLDHTWGAARRFQLVTRVAGPDSGAALDGLLTRWREHLAKAAGTDDPDSAAVVTWPSRDTAGVAALLRHGLAPLAVIAARPAGRQAAGRAAAAGVTVRRAGPGDLAEMVRLGMHVIRYDAQFGGVTERPGTEAALARELARQLAEPEPWAWIAERDGAAAGLLTAERPADAGWIAPVVAAAPAAYLDLGGAEPGARGTGVGAALADRFHQEADAAGVAVTLLHYALLNPLSGPFWSTQGYRPLWTIWEARPAASLR